MTETLSGRHLVVAHYHLRPGGVRRVIEMTVPAVASCGGISGITLATGEAPSEEWLDGFRRSLGSIPLHLEIRSDFLYWSELDNPPPSYERNLQKICEALLVREGGEECVLWTHNLALGRNVPLARAWALAAQKTGAFFVSHHHDFFFDNRWARWPEISAGGCQNLAEAARVVFPIGPRVIHLAINRADHGLLARGFGERASWLPNPATPERHTEAEESQARDWLAARIGTSAPYWLLPCRLLRRKNVAESVLLARWLRPQVEVVTTGGASSPDEELYAARLSQAARKHGWRLNLSVLSGTRNSPPVASLLGGAEAVLLTSLQEGFGLPYLEAAVANRPLLARHLPNVLPDLISLGLDAPTTYGEVMVPLSLFHHGKEIARQRALWLQWRSRLPAEVRALAGEPLLLAKTEELIPFSRLTFTAQEEVLARSSEDLQAALAPANPCLAQWRGLEGALPPATLDESTKGALTAKAFATKFWEAVAAASTTAVPSAESSSQVMHSFLADRLGSGNLYPLLFAPDS